MRSVGLITEYNPFHNGHQHHLRESLQVAEAEVAVAVMSGHFLQRGEPALVDKWQRAEMALAAGVDVVVELPLPWACSSAPDFARGAVQALDALGGIDSLCFGSETGDVTKLQRCADFLCTEAPIVAECTAQRLRNGLSYPQARAQILAESLPQGLDPEQLAAPNNILGIEYLRALRQTESPIVPVSIQRIGSGYHDTRIGVDGIASATGIRNRLAANAPVKELVPEKVFPLLQQALTACHRCSSERYLLLLLAQIIRAATNLDAVWLVENGIESRLLDAARRAVDLEQLIVAVKSRQLTRTRIQRMLVSILLGMESSAVRPLLEAGPRYLHLLAVSRKGERFLAHGRRQRTLPLVQNFSRVYALLKRHFGAGSADYRLAMTQLELQLRATGIYSLLLERSPDGNRNRDFYEPLRVAVSENQGEMT